MFKCITCGYELEDKEVINSIEIDEGDYTLKCYFCPVCNKPLRGYDELIDIEKKAKIEKVDKDEVEKRHREYRKKY